ncbi:MAG TPA: FAD-linked oxidase C-terminal domain-containing protein, partial [Gemmataceae bacterium]
GPGLVLDCSKYLNRIGPLDVASRRVWVQPGVVLDHLNAALAAHGLQFGPDVATANRATLGGMLGNNSAGARSIVYGKTADHTHSLRVILSDGTPAEFGPVSGPEWERRAEVRTLEGAAYRAVWEAARRNRGEITRRFPHILRRVSGYNLAAYAEPECSPAWASWLSGLNPSADGSAAVGSLVPLLVGSEGTLAVVAEAELGLVPRPKFRGLLVPHFDSLAAALDALAACLEPQPSAVELIDQMLIDLAREQRSLKETMAAVRGRPAALLMVEFSGDDPAEVADRVEKLGKRLKEVPGLTAAVPALDPATRDPLWKLRSAAVPLLFGMRGDRKPVTFCEDTAVPPERLPEFAARIRDLFRRHGTDGSFYGHASVGCLHIRPVLNLKDPGDVALMRRIMEDVTDLVLRFGGALSGEHGDGLVRSEWNRKMYGPVIYEAFRQIKRAFDPENVLNPGKIVDAPAMTESLRFVPQSQVVEPPTVFDYRAQEGFFRSIELCNGSGVCRKTQGGTMCPSYRATRDERDTTRGRANALRLALTGREDVANPRGPGLKGRWLEEVMDLCLSCKACKSECPSNVDLAKLKAEYLHAHYEKRLRPLGHYFTANVHRLNRYGAAVAPLFNWANRSRPVRWLLEKAAGIDRRRSLPELHRNHLRRWFSRHEPPGHLEYAPRVILLDDCFTTYNEPWIGRAAVRVLEAAGFRVELAGLVCCGRAMISKGFLKEARELAWTQVPALAKRVADGTPILGLEPSCLLALADEWPELVPGPEARRVAEAAHLAEHWLADQAKAGRVNLPLSGSGKPPRRCLFHGHCHQKALCGVGGTASALRRVPGLDVTVLDAGCCGMAGAFGYEKEHFDISVKIANLELVPALEAAPEALVVATGTSCRHQIRDLTGRRALHPVEVLASALTESEAR